MRHAIIRATAQTLRHVAAWPRDVKDDEFYNLAHAVELMETHDDGMGCPVCEEGDCDSDCPLAPIRAAYNPRRSEVAAYPPQT
jgi:hypothetical protein